METKELTCIGCPMGCQITVTMENGAVVSVAGNSCKIGDTYARKEVICPMRIVTSTVRVVNDPSDLKKDPVKVPVKTSADIPKSAIFDVMDVIHKTCAKAPVKIGDIIVENVANTGVNIIATKDYPGK
ncbi:MAG: DUF1667 domain-containing protein [Proteobacteria bacterium]|nr:DUF1667 domain-containing protein [Pseudomonadota bacterium]